MWGIHMFCRFCPEERGALNSRGFILIQDNGDCSHKDFWVHFGTLERPQVFSGIFGIRFIVFKSIHRLI